jgi:hypothetical protein
MLCCLCFFFSEPLSGGAILEFIAQFNEAFVQRFRPVCQIPEVLTYKEILSYHIAHDEYCYIEGVCFGITDCGKCPQRTIWDKQNWRCGITIPKDKEIADEKAGQDTFVNYYGDFDAHRLGGR